MRSTSGRHIGTALGLITALCLAAGLTGCGKDEAKAPAKKPFVKRKKAGGAAAKPGDEKKGKDRAEAEKKAAPGVDKAVDKKPADDETGRAPAAAPKVAADKPAGDEIAAAPSDAPDSPLGGAAPATDPAAAAAPAAPAPPGEPPVAGEPAAAAEPAPALVEPGAPAEPAPAAPAEPEPAAPNAADRVAAALPPSPVPDLEADRPAPKAPAEPALDISGYLSIADLERVLDKKHSFRRSELPGLKATPDYNALYYADSRDKEFGVSVQVWRDRNLVDSRTRFNTLRNTYTDVVETNRVTAQGFRAYYGGVVTLVFADPRRPLLAAVSCSIKMCSANAAIELSRRVSERMR